MFAAHSASDLSRKCCQYCKFVLCHNDIIGDINTDLIDKAK